MNIIFLSYFPAIVGLCLLGLVAYKNDPRSRVNKLFALFVGLLAIWLAALFFADSASTDESALWALRIALVAGSSLGFSFLLLCDSFPVPTRQKLSGRTKEILGSLTVICMGLALTDSIAPNAELTDSGVTFELTALYSLVNLFLLLQIIAGIVIVRRRMASVSIVQQYQIRLFTYGMMIAVAINIIPGIVFIILEIESTLTALLTSVSFFMLALFILTAVTRYQLFNIRKVIARTIAYVLSAVLIAAVYGYVVSIIIEQNIESETVQFVIVGISTLFAVTVFSPLKRTFDKLTNRLFYREAYSSREKLDALTDKLVSNIELKKLVADSCHVIKSAVQPQKIAIVLTDQATNRSFINRKDLDAALSRVKPHAHSKFIRTSDIPEADNSLLRKKNVELIVPIRSTNTLEGYLVLGPRESGEVYSSQDLAFLVIAARNIGLALTNAKSYQEIGKLNDSLQERVDEATKKLRQKNKELERLHKTKDDFISMASHQLRPKITAVQGFLSMLKPQITDKKQAEMVGLTASGVQQMSDVVVDMLDVSVMDPESMHLELSKKPIALADLVYKQVEDYFKGKTDHNYEMRVTPDARKVALRIDAIKIREVLLNLLDNACQYSPDGSMIIVRITSAKQTLTVVVEDSGIGMSQKDQEYLFDKFYRSDSAKRMRPAGSGIGLYMAQKIIQAHGGKMVVKSAKGKGSTIGFQLPRRES